MEVNTGRVEASSRCMLVAGMAADNSPSDNMAASGEEAGARPVAKSDSCRKC